MGPAGAYAPTTCVGEEEAEEEDVPEKERVVDGFGGDDGEGRMKRLTSSRTSSSHRLSPIPSEARMTMSFARTGTTILIASFCGVVVERGPSW